MALHLISNGKAFVGREIEELRWKLLAEGKWKGLSTRQNSESKSRPLLPGPGSRRQGWLDSQEVQGLSWRDGSI